MASYAIPLSGLQADSSLLNVISNNLANLNTDGYKNETLNFGDIFAEAQGASGNGDPIQIGSGVAGRRHHCKLQQWQRRFDWHCVEHGAPRQRNVRGAE